MGKVRIDLPLMRVYKKMIVDQEQIDEVQEWKKRPRKVRQYYCPFAMSSIGGEICTKAFKRCRHNPDKYPPIVNKNSFCFTTPCPCQIYTFEYVMNKARSIIKYGRI